MNFFSVTFFFWDTYVFYVTRIYIFVLFWFSKPVLLQWHSLLFGFKKIYFIYLFEFEIYILIKTVKVRNEICITLSLQSYLHKQKYVQLVLMVDLYLRIAYSLKFICNPKTDYLQRFLSHLQTYIEQEKFLVTWHAPY